MASRVSDFEIFQTAPSRRPCRSHAGTHRPVLGLEASAWHSLRRRREKILPTGRWYYLPPPDASAILAIQINKSIHLHTETVCKRPGAKRRQANKFNDAKDMSGLRKMSRGNRTAAKLRDNATADASIGPPPRRFGSNRRRRGRCAFQRPSAPPADSCVASRSESVPFRRCSMTRSMIFDAMILSANAPPTSSLPALV
jgi:hypothetical protein